MERAAGPASCWKVMALTSVPRCVSREAGIDGGPASASSLAMTGSRSASCCAAARGVTWLAMNPVYQPPLTVRPTVSEVQAPGADGRPLGVLYQEPVTGGAGGPPARLAGTSAPCPTR